MLLVISCACGLSEVCVVCGVCVCVWYVCGVCMCECKSEGNGLVQAFFLFSHRTGALNVPDNVVFCNAPVKCLSRKALLVESVGSREANVTLSIEKPFKVSPKTLFLAPGNKTQLELVFFPEVCSFCRNNDNNIISNCQKYNLYWSLFTLLCVCRKSLEAVKKNLEIRYDTGEVVNCVVEGLPAELDVNLESSVLEVSIIS